MSEWKDIKDAPYDINLLVFSPTYGYQQKDFRELSMRIGCLELKRVGVYKDDSFIGKPDYYIYRLQWVGKKIFRITRDFRFK